MIFMVVLAAFAFIGLFAFGMRLHAQALAGPHAYYANCGAARAAGVDPIHRGEPGYRPELDADHDGVACEPRP